MKIIIFLSVTDKEIDHSSKHWWRQIIVEKDTNKMKIKCKPIGFFFIVLCPYSGSLMKKRYRVIQKSIDPGVACTVENHCSRGINVSGFRRLPFPRFCNKLMTRVTLTVMQQTSYP